MHTDDGSGLQSFIVVYYPPSLSPSLSIYLLRFHLILYIRYHPNRQTRLHVEIVVEEVGEKKKRNAAALLVVVVGVGVGVVIVVIVVRVLVLVLVAVAPSEPDQYHGDEKQPDALELD